MRSATSTRSRPVWLCSLQERTSGVSHSGEPVTSKNIDLHACQDRLSAELRWVAFGFRNLDNQRRRVRFACTPTSALRQRGDDQYPSSSKFEEVPLNTLC